jgi:large subunit ribosomal protein L25
MSETNELTAEVRDRVGKGAARAVRREDKVPAVIYGDKKPPIPISLPQRELSQRLHAGGFLTHITTIDVNGEKLRVIPRDYQLDPVRDFLIHVDFLRVAEGARLTLDIPVHFINEHAAPGIKRGGALNIVRHTIELYVPADAIPEAIEVDLTGLDIGDSLHISAVTLPEGVTATITDRDFTIATIAGHGASAADAGEAGGEGEAGGAEPKA